jgi:hypothetical protein
LKNVEGSQVPGMSEPRLVEVRRNVLKQNDVIARALREQFRAAGVYVVSLVSSPGSGKRTSGTWCVRLRMI